MATSKTTGSDRRVQIGKDAIGNTIVTGDKNKIIIYQTIQQVETEQPSVAEIGPNPYLGLGPFQEKDADRFFGREKLTEQLWKKFRDLNEPSVSGEPIIRLLPIIGPSGSGKSSLARAGLIPELARQPLPGLDSARIAVLTPGTHPLEALAGVMARIATNDASPVKKTGEFFEVLNKKYKEEHYDGLLRIANLLPSIENSSLVVMVDQFEEVYSLCEDKDERQVFIENLLHTACDRSGRVSVILTLRSDFLGETQSNEKLNIAIARQGEIVPAMSEAELRNAISKPAANAGHPLDEYTIDQLISQTKGREGALPLLQFALTRIWEGLAEGIEPAQSLRNIGGVGGALAGEAERLYDKLKDDQKNTARRAFMAMVQLGEGTRDTRRRVRIADLTVPGEDSEQVRRVLNIFSRRATRLITLSSDEAGIQTAEVSHEALLEHWHALNTWLDNSRDDLRFQRRMDEATRHWENKGRPEGLIWRPPDLDLLDKFHQRKRAEMNQLQIEFFEASLGAEKERAREKEKQQKRVRNFAIVLAVLLLLAIGASYVANEQRREKHRQGQIALARQLAAQSELTLNQRADLLERSVLLAVESMQRFMDLGENSLQADQVLRRGLVLLPLPVARFTHGHNANNFSVSPNWRYFAIAGVDSTAKIWKLASGEEIATLHHDGEVLDVVFSVSGNLVATVSDDHTAKMWETRSGRLISTFQHLSGVVRVKISQDENFLATSSWDNTVTIWNISTEEEVAHLKHPGNVLGLYFSPDGQFLITGSDDTDDKAAHIWEIASGRQLNRLIHNGKLTSLNLSPNGQMLVTTSEDSTARIWRIPHGDEVAKLQHNSEVLVAAFSQENQYLATTDNNSAVHIWTITDGRKISNLEHDNDIFAVFFSPDKKHIATVSWDNTARIWDIFSGQEIVRVSNQRDLLGANFSPDGSHVATVSRDGSVWFWDLTSRNEQLTFKHADRVAAIEFSPDARKLATASWDNKARVWDIKSARDEIVMKHSSFVVDVTYNPAGTELTTACWDQNFSTRLWRTINGQQIDFKVHESCVNAVAFSPDGSYSAEAGSNGKVGIINNTSNEEPINLSHKSSVNDLVFSLDGSYLATASDDSTVAIWSVGSWEKTNQMRHPDRVRAVCFHPDGKYLATAGDDGYARIWDLTTGKESFQLQHDLRLWDIAFSPKGKFLVTAGSDFTASIWETSTKQKIAQLSHRDEILAVRFSPDGKYVATGSADGTAKIWLWQPRDLINESKMRLTRTLTHDEWQEFLDNGPYPGYEELQPGKFLKLTTKKEFSKK